MAEIRFTRRAMRDIRKLPPEARRSIAIALDELMDNPRAGVPLRGDWEGYLKLRTRDYRVIYRVTGRDIVEVQYVRHRREAYRR